MNSQIDPELVARQLAVAHPAALAYELTKDDPVVSLRYHTPRHVRWASIKLMRAIKSKGGPGEPKKRVMVFEPPRHGKSELTSHRTPVWFLNNWPDKRVMFGTYSADFSTDWGRKVRNTIQLYQHKLNVRLSEDSTSANSWHTTLGGGMMAQGIGGAFTGRGASLLICDDPYKNLQDANSVAYREMVWGWWTSAFLTRVEPDATVILTLTRWHADDLAGRILADPAMAAEWEVIKLPALAKEGDPLGRKPGEALWPERKSRAALLKEQIAVGPYVWSALYDQEPPDIGGGKVYKEFVYAEWRDNQAGNIDSDACLVKGEPIDLSIDFNKRPGSHAIIGQYLPENDTATALVELHTPGGVAKDITLAFVDWWKANAAENEIPYVNLYGDASGGSGSLTDGESAWQKVHEILDINGIDYSFRVPLRNPGVHNRVESVNNALINAKRERRYRIRPECHRLIRDLQKVDWDKGKIDKSNVELSHASDADGYRIAKIMPIQSADGVDLSGDPPDDSYSADVSTD